jgi:hypothetical protein
MKRFKYELLKWWRGYTRSYNTFDVSTRRGFYKAIREYCREQFTDEYIIHAYDVPVRYPCRIVLSHVERSSQNAWYVTLNGDIIYPAK